MTVDKLAPLGGIANATLSPVAVNTELVFPAVWADMIIKDPYFGRIISARRLPFELPPTIIKDLAEKEQMKAKDVPATPRPVEGGRIMLKEGNRMANKGRSFAEDFRRDDDLARPLVPLVFGRQSGLHDGSGGQPHSGHLPSWRLCTESPCRFALLTTDHDARYISLQNRHKAEDPEAPDLLFFSEYEFTAHQWRLAMMPFLHGRIL